MAKFYTVPGGAGVFDYCHMMNSTNSSDYLDILRVPKDEKELAWCGAVLYLLGLFCTFCFYSQFGILSIDVLKPQCILIGLYVWLFAIGLPRILIVGISLFKINHRAINVILVAAALAVTDYTIYAATTGQALLMAIIALFLQFLYYSSYRPIYITAVPSRAKGYLFIIVLAYLFSTTLLPAIPQYFGGTKPAGVTLNFKGKDLLHNRFEPKADTVYNFLYETDHDYYFLEPISDANSGITFEYFVQRIPKDEIRKMQFHTSLWTKF